MFVQAFERHHQIGPGESALFLNGRSVDMDIYDTFTLLDIMSMEAKLVEGLHSLGFKVRQHGVNGLIVSAFPGLQGETARCQWCHSLSTPWASR